MGVTRPAPRRRRRALRLLPVLVIAGAAFAGRDGGRRRRGSDEREVVERFAPGVGARRLRRDARGAHGRVRRARARGELRAAATARPPTRRPSSRSRGGPAGAPPRRRRRVPVAVAHARVRHDPRHDAGAGGGTRTTARGSPGRSGSRSWPARGEKLQRAHARSPSAPTCSRATARRSPRARRGPRSLASASAIAGALGADPEASARASCAARGVPSDARSARRARARVRRPARRDARRRAARRRRATSAPRSPSRAPDVRTSIAPSVQTAAVDALAGRLGGIAAHPGRSTGEILALSGVAFSGLQPPGSTFKIVTLAARTGGEGRQAELELCRSRLAGDARRRRAAERQRRVVRRNAHATRSPHSCNSVFAPLAVKPGADKLVAMAEHFGFNQPTGIPVRRRARSRPRRRSTIP